MIINYIKKEIILITFNFDIFLKNDIINNKKPKKNK